MDEGTQGAAIGAIGIPVYTLNMQPYRSPLAALLHLRRLLSSLQPDVVHGWMYHGGLAALLTKSHAAAVIGIRQSLYDLRFEKMGTRLAIRALGRLALWTECRVIYNAAVSARQHEAMGFPAGESLVIPNGFDCERFRPDPDARGRIRNELGIDEHAWVIGHIANFRPMKDHACFLRAATLVAKTHPGGCFLLAGIGVDAGNPGIVEFLDDQALKGRVHLLGERSDVSDLYNASDIFCLSSSWGEGFPNVLGEAMACGVPCVTTDVGDSPELVGDTGRVVPPRDPNALAATLMDLLALDQEERLAMGVRGRRRVIEHYSLRSVVSRYEEMYTSLVARARV
jgi:glycosyltransferase involved in cell wall biosynthesis